MTPLFLVNDWVAIPAFTGVICYKLMHSFIMGFPWEAVGYSVGTRINKTPPLNLFLIPYNSAHAFTYKFLKIYIDINFLSTSWSLICPLPLRFLQQKFLYYFLMASMHYTLTTNLVPLANIILFNLFDIGVKLCLSLRMKNTDWVRLRAKLQRKCLLEELRPNTVPSIPKGFCRSSIRILGTNPIRGIDLLWHIRGSFTKYVFLGPCTETKHNCMEIYIATDTASVQLFSNIFATGIETFVIPWDQLLYTVS
jgi:hypothetical protein